MSLLDEWYMRKRTEKSKNTRTEIYKSAIRLFQHYGYEETTMRMIAREAKVSLGLAYYHFKSKDDIVFHFYELVQKESEEDSIIYCDENRDFRERVRHILQFKVTQFMPHANFLHVLAKLSGDPKSPLSPFSKECSEFRAKEIQSFRYAMVDTNQKFPEEFIEVIPELFWLLELVIIYYCLYDKSVNKKNTMLVLDSILYFIFQLLRVARLPFMKPLRKSFMNLTRLVKNNY
jgi:AcrR family transcriptional regulator